MAGSHKYDVLKHMPHCQKMHLNTRRTVSKRT